MIYKVTAFDEGKKTAEHFSNNLSDARKFSDEMNSRQQQTIIEEIKEAEEIAE